MICQLCQKEDLPDLNGSYTIGIISLSCDHDSLVLCRVCKKNPARAVRQHNLEYHSSVELVE